MRFVLCWFVLVALAGGAAPLAAAGSAAPDTAWFGGTVWAADSSRWEAIPGGVWTFDSGVGSALAAPGNPPHKESGLHRLMEGWIGWDLGADTDRPYFRRLAEADFSGENAVCVGAAAGFAGTASFYAGALTPEAADFAYVGGRGYGNRWSLIAGKTFAYPGSGDVTLSFEFANDTEPGFDFTYAEVDTSGDGSAPPLVLAVYDGAVSGSASVVLTQAAGRLRADAGPIVIRFRVDSDGSYSDEDGLYPTVCGAFTFDAVVLSGAIDDVSDFESGDDGWALIPNPPGPGGDWSTLRALADLPGTPLPGCVLADSVLTFFDPSAGVIAAPQYNVAVSPWIDLARAGAGGRAGRMIEMDVFQDFVRPEYVGIEILVQYRPAVAGAPGGFRVPYGCFFGPDPCLYANGCASPFRLSIEATSAGIPPTAEEVRLAVGVSNICEVWGDCPGPNTDASPYFDNVRFAVFDTAGAVTGVGEDLPDPGRLAIRLRDAVARDAARFALRGSVEGEATVAVFDVAGREVRRLYAGPLPGGTLELTWDLRGWTGRPVASGVYFVRAVGRGSMALARIVVAR